MILWYKNPHQCIMKQFIVYSFVIIFLLLSGYEFYSVVGYALFNIKAFQWLGYGFIGYFILHRLKFIAQNEQWLRTHSHEFTHAIVGMFLARKIHSLQANESNGVVYHSGGRFGDVFISIAPYCLPLLTYCILFFRIFGDHKLYYVFDLFVGLTLAFHVSCFWRDTGFHQSDLKKHGKFKSLILIIALWLFNSAVVLLSIKCGLKDAIVNIFCNFWSNIVNFGNLFF